MPRLHRFSAFQGLAPADLRRLLEWVYMLGAGQLEASALLIHGHGADWLVSVLENCLCLEGHDVSRIPWLRVTDPKWDWADNPAVGVLVGIPPEPIDEMLFEALRSTTNLLIGMREHRFTPSIESVSFELPHPRGCRV